MHIHIAETSLLKRLLNRKKRRKEFYGLDLGDLLRDILTWANSFVPAESGSILFDDPVIKKNPKKKTLLYFAGCFGKSSETLVGTSLHDTLGIVGETYHTRQPYISKDVKKDKKFFSKIDKKTGYETTSIICAPIIINKSVIGVIELINRRGQKNFNMNDLVLLEIFAGYTASVIHTGLIARSFEELAKRDNLTGLFNDRYFYQTLEGEVKRVLRKNSKVTLIFFDLDHFKDVNDTHGHLAGSAVLKEVAELLNKLFRGTKAVIARYGGDEFVIVLPDTGLHASGDYAERLRACIAGHTFLKKRRLGFKQSLNIKNLITCSVGVACLPENVSSKGTVRDTVEQLIRAADSAMYTAKERGKNMVFVQEK